MKKLNKIAAVFSAASVLAFASPAMAQTKPSVNPSSGSTVTTTEEDPYYTDDFYYTYTELDELKNMSPASIKNVYAGSYDILNEYDEMIISFSKEENELSKKRKNGIDISKESTDLINRENNKLYETVLKITDFAVNNEKPLSLIAMNDLSSVIVKCSKFVKVHSNSFDKLDANIEAYSEGITNTCFINARAAYASMKSKRFFTPYDVPQSINKEDADKYKLPHGTINFYSEFIKYMLGNSGKTLSDLTGISNPKEAEKSYDKVMNEAQLKFYSYNEQIDKRVSVQKTNTALKLS